MYLLFRPGLLCKEYCSGRRVSYIRPVKLYLFTSILCFVIIAAVNFYTDISSFESDEVIEIDRNEKPTVGLEDNAELEIEESAEGLNPNQNDTDWSDSFDLDSDSEFAKRIEFKVESAIKAIKQDPSIVQSLLLDMAPSVIFCFLPLFALLLKLSYLTKRVYYTEHLILALHNHSFLFLVSTFMVVMNFSLQNILPMIERISFAIWVWVPVYMWLSMKRIYQQGSILTTIKFLLLCICYFALVVCVIMLCFIFWVMAL